MDEPEDNQEETRAPEATPYRPVEKVYDDEEPAQGQNEDNDAEASDEDLADAEDGGEREPGHDRSEKKEGKKLQDAVKPEDSESEPTGRLGKLKQKLKSKAGSISNAKPALIIGGGLGSIGLIVVLFVVIMALIGPLKGVHFSQVLGSTGFAVFQRSMSKIYTNRVLDRSLALDATNADGTAKRLGVSGWSAQKLAEMGRSEDLKWVGQTASGKEAIQMRNADGKLGTYSLDDTVSSLFGEGKKYGDLSLRQKWYARSQFSNTIRNNIARVTAMEKLSYRAPALNTLHAKAGIYRFRWTARAAEYLGKKPGEATRLNFRDRVRAVLHADYTAPVVSGVGDDTKREAEKRNQALKEANLQNQEYRKVKYQSLTDWNAKIEGGAKRFSDIALLAVLYCMNQYIDRAYMETKGGKEIGSLRQGADAIVVGEQMMAGDATNEAVEAQNASLVGAETAAAYQYAIGNGLEEGYINELMDIPSIYDDNKFLEINHAISEAMGWSFIGLTNRFFPAVGEVSCDFVMNEAVQWTIGGLELLAAIGSGGVFKFVSEGAMAAFKVAIRNSVKMIPQAAGSIGIGWIIGKYVDQQIQSLSGEAYTGAMNGPDRINQDAASISNLQSHEARTLLYASPVSRTSAVQSTQVAIQELRDQYNQRGFSERYFAISNPFSLLGRTTAVIPTTFTGYISKIKGLANSATSFLVSPFKVLSNSSNMFMMIPGAKAAGLSTSALTMAGDDYGVVEAMWSNEDLAEIDNDPDYSKDALERDIVPRLDELRVTYKIEECYESGKYQSELPDYCKDPSNFINISREGKRLRYYLAGNALEKLDQTPVSEIVSDSLRSTTTATQSSTRAGTGEVAWEHPAIGKSVTQRFGAKSKYGISGKHTGIDFGGKFTVNAACSGVVKLIHPAGSFVSSEWTSSDTIVISCNDGRYETGYHHTAALGTLKEGMSVNAGDPIGNSNNSGISFSTGGGDGSHLHLTVKDLQNLTNGMRGFVDPDVVIFAETNGRVDLVP